MILIKAVEALSREEETGKNCKVRLGTLKEHADTRKNAQLLWKKKRLERMLVDHFLRSGYYETAILMAKKADIEVRNFQGYCALNQKLNVYMRLLIVCLDVKYHC